MGDLSERRQSRTGILQGTLDMLILQILDLRPRYGYALSKAIRINSGEILKIYTGTLYPALHRMARKGWIVAEWKVSQIGPRSRIYTLTAKGREQLTTKRSHWEKVANAIARIMDRPERLRDP